MARRAKTGDEHNVWLMFAMAKTMTEADPDKTCEYADRMVKEFRDRSPKTSS